MAIKYRLEILQNIFNQGTNLVYFMSVYQLRWDNEIILLDF